jgi:hypothetical protein
MLIPMLNAQSLETEKKCGKKWSCPFLGIVTPLPGETGNSRLMID